MHVCSFFFCTHKRKTEPKRKSAGCRSGAKKEIFPEQNELASYRGFKQHFVLFGKFSFFLYAPSLKAGECISPFFLSLLPLLLLFLSLLLPLLFFVNVCSLWIFVPLSFFSFCVLVGDSYEWTC